MQCRVVLANAPAGTREGNGATPARGSQSQLRHLLSNALVSRLHALSATCWCPGVRWMLYRVSSTHPVRLPEVRVRRLDDIFRTAVQYRAAW
jgi:hypothetical protein